MNFLPKNKLPRKKLKSRETLKPTTIHSFFMEKKMAKIQRSWDAMDEEAERAGNARKRFRELEALPSIMGKRIQMSKSRYGNARCATNLLISSTREEKTGFGA